MNLRNRSVAPSVWHNRIRPLVVEWDGKVQLRAFTSIGGYPLAYLKSESADRPGVTSMCCAECATEAHRHDANTRIVDALVNYEDPDLECETCGERIESAYAEPQEEIES